MFIAQVKGTITSTIKHPVYRGRKLLILQPLDLHGQPWGKSLLAIDEVQAGEGDIVLVLNEGSSARFIVRDELAPVRAVVVGVVDHYLP